MIEKKELRRWLSTLTEEGVAIDDGGLAIVELDGDNRPTEAYFEIGGVPEEDTCPKCGSLTESAEVPRYSGVGTEVNDYCTDITCPHHDWPTDINLDALTELRTVEFEQKHQVRRRPPESTS